MITRSQAVRNLPALALPVVPFLRQRSAVQSMPLPVDTCLTLFNVRTCFRKGLSCDRLGSCKFLDTVARPRR